VTDSLAALEREVVACRACPRLVAWREEAAATPPRRYAGEDYWARPVPGFGDSSPWLALIGLAPAAHGANRTGRMFTGDRSGDFLYAALHRAGLADRPASVSADDGLTLLGCRITAAVRCAPPANKPAPEEADRCRPFLRRELALLGDPPVLLALGAFGWRAVLIALDAARPWPRFGHGAEAALGTTTLIGSYHPSQQNTFTGRLTPQMLDAVLARARELAGRRREST
jgi:uracil-DNA glycosylase family 4